MVQTFNWDLPWQPFAFLVVCLALFCVWAYYNLDVEDRTGRWVLLVGLPDSGKTSLFMKMQGITDLKTYTSMTANEAAFRFERENPREPKIEMVDIPGHDRVRGEALEKYARKCRGVVFTIDSASFSKNSRDVAACLYSLLALNPIRRGVVPVYVLCNKQDLLTATPVATIKSTLEAEMDTLRKTRAVSSHVGEGEAFLGDANKPFAFEQMPNRIEFEAGAIENIAEVSKWVRTNVSKDHYNTLPDWLKPLHDRIEHQSAAAKTGKAEKAN